MQHARKHQLLRLAMTPQKLAVVQPVGGGTARIRERSVESQGALIRLRGVAGLAGFFLKLGKMRQRQTLERGIVHMSREANGRKIFAPRITSAIPCRVGVGNFDVQRQQRFRIVAMFRGMSCSKL